MIQKNPQTSLHEKKITDAKAIAAATALAEVEAEMEKLPMAEIRALEKRKKDEKEKLVEAIPVVDEEVLYRVGDYLILCTPPPEPTHVEFDRRPKPRVMFVNPDDE